MTSCDKRIIERQWELLGRAEDLLNPGREHRMYMDKDCEICRWLGQVGDLTLEPPKLTDKELMEARNELSDLIHTWNGTGVDDLSGPLSTELEKILAMFDAVLFPKATS